MKCRKCGEEFEGEGALVLSPSEVPTAYPATVSRFHICLKCWWLLVAWLNGK